MDFGALTDQQLDAISSYETDQFDDDERARYLEEYIRRGRADVLFDPNDTVEFYGVPNIEITRNDRERTKVSA